MAFEQLSLPGFVKEMKAVTKGAHPRRFCFVLGAGASRSSGIKSGQELVRLWDKELRERNEEEYLRWRSELGITDQNMSNFYSYYYEKRFRRCPADGLNFIESIMESAKPSAGYVMLSHILTETPHNVVITTNFDHLTEDAVTYYAQKTPLVVGHEALAHYIAGQQVRPTIIKIHRDLLFDPKSRTEELEKLAGGWEDALSRIFKNYHPIFVGYAGNDKSLMQFLIDNSEKFANDEWKYPYWMLYKTDKLDGMVKDFVEQSNGYIIRHNGFDEVMIPMGAAFDYTLPKEEVFLEDAKNRYRSLKDSIDALSDALSEKSSAKPSTTQAEVNEKKAEDSEAEAAFGEALVKITSQSEMQDLYRQAMQKMDDGDYPTAVAILENLVKEDAKNVRYRLPLARAYLKSDRAEEARNIVDQLLKDEPDNGEIHMLSGDIWIKLGNNDKACMTYLDALDCDSDDEFFYRSLGHRFRELKEIGMAEEAYLRASEISPESDFPYHWLASMYHSVGDYERALTYAQKAVDANSEDWSNYVLLRLILLEMNQPEKAAEISKKIEALEKEGK